MAKKFSDPEFEEFDDFETETFEEEDLNLPEAELYAESSFDDDESFAEEADTEEEDFEDDYEVSIRPKGRGGRYSDDEDWSDY